MTSTKCQASESDLPSSFRAGVAFNLSRQNSEGRWGGINACLSVVVRALWEPSRGRDKDLKLRQMTLTAKH